MSDRWWRSKKANEAAAARERLFNRLREADRLANELNWAEARRGDGLVVIIPGGPDWRAKVIESETFADPRAELPEIGVQNSAGAEAEIAWERGYDEWAASGYQEYAEEQTRWWRERGIQIADRLVDDPWNLLHDQWYQFRFLKDDREPDIDPEPF